MKQRQRFFARVLAAALGLMAGVVCAEIQVAEGWSRETVPGATSGAGYFVITNTGDAERTLMRLTSTVSDSVMMHVSSVDAQVSRACGGLAAVQPCETVRFEPTGRH